MDYKNSKVLMSCETSEFQTDKQLRVNQPDIVMTVVIPVYSNIGKEHEETENYQKLKEQLEQMWRNSPK